MDNIISKDITKVLFVGIILILIQQFIGLYFNFLFINNINFVLIIMFIFYKSQVLENSDINEKEFKQELFIVAILGFIYGVLKNQYVGFYTIIFLIIPIIIKIKNKYNIILIGQLFMVLLYFSLLIYGPLLFDYLFYNLNNTTNLMDLINQKFSYMIINSLITWFLLILSSKKKRKKDNLFLRR